MPIVSTTWQTEGKRLAKLRSSRTAWAIGGDLVKGKEKREEERRKGEKEKGEKCPSLPLSLHTVTESLGSGTPTASVTCCLNTSSIKISEFL